MDMQDIKRTNHSPQQTVERYFSSDLANRVAFIKQIAKNVLRKSTYESRGSTEISWWVRNNNSHIIGFYVPQYSAWRDFQYTLATDAEQAEAAGDKLMLGIALTPRDNSTKTGTLLIPAHLLRYDPMAIAQWVRKELRQAELRHLDRRISELNQGMMNAKDDAEEAEKKLAHTTRERDGVQKMRRKYSR